jgi:hypothetical protein
VWTILSLTGYLLSIETWILLSGLTLITRSPRTISIAKWMTLPELSGKLSQLYSELCSGFFLDSVWNRR